MIHVRLLKGFIVSGSTDLDAHTDAVMEELLELECESISDADVSANLTELTVEISIVAGAESFDDAMAIADAATRTAIHAAGGSTPAWRQVMFAPQKSEAGLVDA